MDQDDVFRPSLIEGLSVELVRMILSALPDVKSLQTAVSSCPLFSHAFLEAETAITAQVLLNQIDSSVLPEAIAVFESSRLRPHNTEDENRHAIPDFVAQNLHQRPTLPRPWSLQNALCLGRLHFYVDWFAGQFAMTASAKRPLTGSKFIASPQEGHRIERALYRFETYCNLFREFQKLQSVAFEEQRPMFFAHFAPWENEQLGCIHDFLVEIVSPAFNDIAEHDVAWGAFYIEYNASVDSPFIQHLLSLGLKKLYQIAKAETYEERYQLLHSGHCPPATDSFLYESLPGANEQNNIVFLDDLTPEDEIFRIRQPYFPDPDPGPADAWRWAHREESSANWVYQEDRRDLRRWGYVMWDRSRLETIGLFQTPWEEYVHNPRDSLLEEQEAVRQRGYMENSWERREQIYARGGTGWWSWGDHSKVRWRGGVTPGQRPSVPKHNEPASLQEAHEMLRMLKLPSSAK